METVFHSSTARLHGHHCLDLRCQNICETAARTDAKQTGSLTHPMRCSSRMIRDVSGGGAVAVTNGEVYSCFFPRGDLWGRPGCQCHYQQRSGFVLGRRAEKRKARGRRTVGVKVVAMANQHQDLYETLGISPTASERDIKQAYRRLALKFHPDVNKEPDAQERFLWIKNAYQTLSDPSSRTRYDAVRRRGDENWSPFGGWGSSGAAKSKEDEDFYGLGEFFRDLEKDLNKRQQEMVEGKGKSLWEELAELGEEFVEFLEKELTIPSPGEAQNSSEAASASGSESEQRDRSKTSAAERVVAIDGDMVAVKYQCTTEDGKLLYASEEPISFEVGAGDVMGNPLFKGFDQASRGLAVGECSSFTERGSEWQEDLVFEVPRNHEEMIRLEKQASASGNGRLMQGSLVELSNGQPAVILQIEDSMVKIDANNPLADLLLRFKVEVVSIERSPDQLGEIADAELHTVHK